MAHLEGLVDISIQHPERPGIVKLDLKSLRTLLLELVRAINPQSPRKPSGSRSPHPKFPSSPCELEKSHFKEDLERDLLDLQNEVSALQQECRRVPGLVETTVSLDREVKAIKDMIDGQSLRVESMVTGEQRLHVQVEALLRRNSMRAPASPMAASEVSEEVAVDTVPGTAFMEGSEAKLLRSLLSDLTDRVETLERREPFTSRKKTSRAEQRLEDTLRQFAESAPLSLKRNHHQPRSATGVGPVMQPPAPVQEDVEEMARQVSPPQVDDVMPMPQTGRTTSTTQTASAGVEEEQELGVMEHKFILSNAFEEFLDALEALNKVKSVEVQDFLTALRDEPALTADMIQELMLILSAKQGVSVNMLYPLVAMLESSSVKISHLVELLRVLLSSDFDVTAFGALLTAMSRPNSRLTPRFLQEMLEVVVAANRISPSAMAHWLKFLSRLDGLPSCIKSIMHLTNFSPVNLIEILEVLRSSKTLAAQELAVVVKNTPKEELVDIIDMLFQIPGYANELLLSLPLPASQDMITLVGRLLSAPKGSPYFLADLVHLMAGEPNVRSVLLCVIGEISDLIQTFDGVSGDGAAQLIHLLLDTEHLNVDGIADFLQMLQKSDFPTEALRAFVQIARTADYPMSMALTDLLRALLTSGMRSDTVTRILRLLEKSTHVTPESLGKLLRTLESTGLLRKDAFIEVSTVGGACQFGKAAHAHELVEALKTQSFLTLEELSSGLKKMHYVTMRDLEDQMRRMSEMQCQRLQELLATYETTGKEVISAVPSASSHESQMEEMRAVLRDLQKNQEVILRQLAKTRNAPSDHASMGVIEEMTLTETESGLAVDSQMVRQEVGELQEMVVSLQQHCQEYDEQIEQLMASVERLQTQKLNRSDLNTLVEAIQPSRSTGNASLARSESTGGTLAHRAKSTGSWKELPAAVSQSASQAPSLCQQMGPKLANTGEEEQARVAVDDKMLEDFSERLVHKQVSEALALQKQASRLRTTSMRPKCRPSAMETQACLERFKKMEDVGMRLEVHEAACVVTIEGIMEVLEAKVDRLELQEFKDAVTRQLHNFVTKQPPLDAAASRRFMKAVCLSCDKKTVCDTEPHPFVPCLGGLPPIKSERPVTVLQTDRIRQQARSLQEPRTTDRLDIYSTRRACGGQYPHVEMFPRTRAWSSETKLDAAGYVKGRDGRIYAGALPAAQQPQSAKSPPAQSQPHTEDDDLQPDGQMAASESGTPPHVTPSGTQPPHVITSNSKQAKK